MSLGLVFAGVVAGPVVPSKEELSISLLNRVTCRWIPVFYVQQIYPCGKGFATIKSGV
jgi:hypothetical protein